MSVPLLIAIEQESPGDSATLFRLRIDQRVVGEKLTAAQTHLLIGEILDRIALPKGATVIPFDASHRQALVRQLQESKANPAALDCGESCNRQLAGAAAASQAAVVGALVAALPGTLHFVTRARELPAFAGRQFLSEAWGPEKGEDNPDLSGD